MVSNTRHRAKILSLLLCLVLIAKAESTAARTELQKLQGSIKRGREQFEGGPGRDALDEFETRNSETSIKRGLLQRRRQSRSQVQSSCDLSSEDVDRFYDASSRQWLINDDVLEELDNDVQTIVECAYDNDTLLFETDQIIKPRRTLAVSQNLTLSSQSEAEEVTGGVVAMPERVRMTCPDSGQLILSRSLSFTLRNLVVEDCNTTKSVIEMNPDCGNERVTGIVRFQGLIIERNVILGQGTIINSSNTRCLHLDLNNVSIRQNRCTRPCVLLSKNNKLNTIMLYANGGSSNFEESSIFSSVEASVTVVRNMTSENNTIRSFHLTNGTLRIGNSHFSDNRKNVSSVARDITIGGGVLFSDHASVSITNTTFRRNYAFNGGALLSWSSNVTVKDCAFRENDAGEGNGGAVYGDYSSSFDVSSSVFSKNRGYRGAGLFSNHTARVDMINVSVRENNSSRSCAFWIANGNTSIKSCEFRRNTADVGGAALGAISLNLTLRNSNFSGNSASQGGACLFELNCTVRASGLLFNNNTARQYGGGIHFNLDGCMRIRDSIFQNNNALIEGGAIRARGECETDLKRIIFLNNTSGDYGGALQIQTGNFTGSNLKFSRNHAENYGGAIGFYEANTIRVFTSHFEDNNAEGGGAVQFDNTLSGSVDSCTFIRNSGYDGLGGAVGARASNVNISTSTFYANVASVGGSVSLLDECNSSIADSSFEDNVAEIGAGVISIRSTCSFMLSNSSFSRNRAQFGGVLVMSDNSNASISRVQFDHNFAFSGGCLYLYDLGKVLVLDTMFSNNTAEGRSGGGAIALHDNFQLLMSNSILEGNHGRSFAGGVSVSSNSSVELTNVSFDRNEARWGGALHMSDSCNATISSCSFINNTAMDNGGGVNLEATSSISIGNSSFIGNKASFGGGLSIWKNSTALVQSGNFAKNNASTSGGAIYIQSSKAVLRSIRLDSNSAVLGGSLFALNASMEVVNSTIRRSHAQRQGGGIYMRATKATLDTVRLESNEVMETGGGIAVVNASSLLCFSCVILNNKASSGAGLHVYSNNSLPIVAQLTNSNFENNTAQSFGGGIEFAAPQNKSINCTSPSVTCGHIVLLNTSFVDNYANHSGAIVLTTDPNKVLVDCEYKGGDRRNQDFLNKTEMNSLEVLNPKQMCASWKRNKVSSNAYGDVVGTYGQEVILSIISKSQVKLVGSMASGYVLENVPSGRQLPTINVTIFDGYGLGPAPTLPHSFETRMSSPDDFFIGVHPTTIVAGVGAFSRVIGLVIPGNYSLEFAFDSDAIETLHMTVIVRECIVGEEATRDRLTCQECDAFSYNFNASVVGGCKECPEDATCEGRYIIPKKGHWHKSPCHDTIQECLVEEACTYKDRQEALMNFTQHSTDCKINKTTINSYNELLCREGYTGPLCGSCKKSFGLSVRFLCSGCASAILSLFTIVGITLYLLGASFLTIRGCLPSNLQTQDYQPAQSQSASVSETTNGDPEVNVEMVKMMVEGHVPQEYMEQRQRARAPPKESRSNQQETEHELTRWKTTEIFKIMLNFLQTIAVAATISVKWTRGMLVLFAGSEYVGVLTTVALSRPVDCITASSSAVAKAIWRMIVSLLVPGFVVSILVSAWGYITFKEKKEWSYFWKRFALSIVAVNYISYLGLTKMAVRAFYCVSIYNSSNPSANTKERFWAVDTAIKCYGKDHSGIITIAVVVICVITVCFPLASAIILSRNKEEQKKRDSWIFETAGFLFRVFKEKLVFWESVVMFRKACLSVIVVFAYPLGGDIQGILASVLLLFCLYLQLIMKPYRKEFKSLNQLESFSLLVSAATFNLGLFFVHDRCSDLVRTLIATIIIFANCMFFLFLLFSFLNNAVVHLKVALQFENVPLSDDTPWWVVIKVYATSRSWVGTHYKN